MCLIEIVGGISGSHEFYLTMSVVLLEGWFFFLKKVDMIMHSCNFYGKIALRKGRDGGVIGVFFLSPNSAC